MVRLLDISPDDYHARPGLSASIAKTIDAQSALHAWQEHPVFGAKGKKPTKVMDRGSVIHRLVLGKGKAFEVLDYNDWRTNDAKAEREKARAAGLTPILQREFLEYGAAALEIRKRLDEAGHFISPDSGTSECAIEWEELSSSGPVLCRCMMDHVRLDTGEIYELKVTDNAHPDACARTAEDLGYPIAAAAYVRALVALRPKLAGGIRYRFLFCEPKPPFAVYAPEPDEMFIESGERRWLNAVEKWGRALKSGRWPHYEDAGLISRPRWALAREGYRRDE